MMRYNLAVALLAMSSTAIANISESYMCVQEAITGITYKKRNGEFSPENLESDHAVFFFRHRNGDLYDVTSWDGSVLETCGLSEPTIDNTISCKTLAANFQLDTKTGHYIKTGMKEYSSVTLTNNAPFIAAGTCDEWVD